VPKPTNLKWESQSQTASLGQQPADSRAWRASERRYYPPVTEAELPEHVARNRVYWDEVNAPLYADPGARAWARQRITWGIFGIPEDQLHALPADVTGMDVVELGCGTAHFGAWLARRGARVTGIDNSAEQLKTARRLQDEHDLHFPLIHGNAEETRLPDASFDLAISEYGPSSGPIRTAGSPRRRASCGLVASSSSSATARSGCSRCPRPTTKVRQPIGCYGRTSGCIGSTGPASPALSSTSVTAIGSGCSERVASRCSI
jgi:hypothetical protein